MGKEVLIKLSFDRKNLIIIRIKEQKPKITKVPITKVLGFILGGFSATFKRYYES